MSVTVQTVASAHLRAEDVHVHFQGVRAVDGVSVSLGAGEILGLIGPNGAGKTTLVNVLTGMQAPDTGRILLGGEDITEWSAPNRARAGLGRTFQGARLFENLTVFENVEAGTTTALRNRRAAKSRAEQLVNEFNLGEVSHHLAGSLPHGLARRLGIARALSIAPQILLLDEPAAGLNEEETNELTGSLRRVRESYEISILVIEHNVPLIFDLCDRVQVLDEGKTIAVGTPEEVSANARVVEAYLGVASGSEDGA